MILPLILLATAAFLDEVGNDIADKKKEYPDKYRFLQKFTVYFFDHRWLMKLAILGIALLGIVPFYFFPAMILFDEAYIMVRWYSQSEKRIPVAVTKKKVILADNQ